MIRSTKRKRPKLSSEWVGSRRIINIKSDSEYLVEDLKGVRQDILHIQQTIPYPAQSGSRKMLADLTLQIERLSSGLQGAHCIEELTKMGGN